MLLWSLPAPDKPVPTVPITALALLAALRETELSMHAKTLCAVLPRAS